MISARYDAFSAVRSTGLLIGAELAGPLRQGKTLTNGGGRGLIALIAGGRAALRAGAQYPAGGYCGSLRAP